MGYSMARNIIKSCDCKSDGVSSILLYDIEALRVIELMDEVKKNSYIRQPDFTVQSSSIRDIAACCDVIITMLPNTQHVRKVYTGKTNTTDNHTAIEDQDSIFSLAKKDTLLLDCSTIDPFESKSLHLLAEERNLQFLDCPVRYVTGYDATLPTIHNTLPNTVVTPSIYNYSFLS